MLKFRISDSDDSTGSSMVKMRTNTTKFTNTIIAIFRENKYLIRKSKV